MKYAMTMPRAVWRAAVAATAALALAALPAAGQANVEIESWNPPASVRSPYIRILDPALTLPLPNPNYFAETVETKAFSPDKTQKAIYVKFDNNSLVTIPNGAVTVTARYAKAPPNLDPGDVLAQLPASGSPVWTLFGSYALNLDVPADAPPGYGLTSSCYPTSFELDDLDDNLRYRILCSAACTEPMPASFFLEVELTLAGETDLTRNKAYAYYDPGVPPADVVLLHDVSGSMSSQLAIAQDRARFFVDLLNIGDRVGVVAFSGDILGSGGVPDGSEIEKSLGAPIASLAPTDPAKSAAFTAIGSFSAGGLTPMGSGVTTARNVLNDLAAVPYAPNRAIVLLTDGRENVMPYLDEPTHAILNSLNAASPQIGLYPLWFGTASHWGLDLLETIETHVAVKKVVDQPTDPLALAEAYLMIRGILTHDDVYDIHRGTAGDGYVGTIEVDAVTHELILAAAWNRFDREFRIEVRRPGSSVWEGADADTLVLDGETYLIYRIGNPAVGLWKYRLGASRFNELPEPYVISALADQVDILMQSNLAESSVSAGEPIVINARLSRGGQGVPGKKVTATVRSPDRALGTILHQVRGQLQTPVQDPNRPVDQPRAAGILQELPGLLGSDELFQLSSNTVTLTDQGDGTYSGRFSDTQVAGTYDVTLVAENPDGSAGFHREHRHAATVSLGPIDRERSVVTVERVGGEQLTTWQVTVIPADIYGNFANPGSGKRITIDAAAGSWIDAAPADLDDGSYTRRLQLPQDQSARVAVTAFGQALPAVTANPGAGRGRRSFSLHAGGSFPSGAFDAAFDAGPSFVLDFGWELKPRLTLFALAGVHDFPGLRGVSSETVTQLSADLRWRFTPATLSPYVQGGFGLYHIFGSWEPGSNTGFGLTYRASPTVDVEGGIDYHDIQLSGSSNAEFWQLHAGFSIRY